MESAGFEVSIQGPGGGHGELGERELGWEHYLWWGREGRPCGRLRNFCLGHHVSISAWMCPLCIRHLTGALVGPLPSNPEHQTHCLERRVHAEPSYSRWSPRDHQDGGTGAGQGWVFLTHPTQLSSSGAPHSRFPRALCQSGDSPWHGEQRQS